MAYPDEQSNIGGSKGRPLAADGRGTMINPARRNGFSGIRDSMRGYEDQISRRDRVKARNVDARLARSYQSLPASAIPSSVTAPGGTVAATGAQLASRQGLFSQMEKAGSGGVTPAMREQARGLGVTDTDFNSAVDRIRGNESYTPSFRTPPPVIPGMAAPTPVAPASAGRAYKSAPAPAGTPGSPIAGPPAPRINKVTGLPFGALPGDSDYVPSWKRGTAYQQDEKGTGKAPSATQPESLSPLAKQGMAIQKNAPELVKIRDEVRLRRGWAAAPRPYDKTPIEKPVMNDLGIPNSIAKLRPPASPAATAAAAPQVTAALTEQKQLSAPVVSAPQNRPASSTAAPATGSARSYQTLPTSAIPTPPPGGWPVNYPQPSMTTPEAAAQKRQAARDQQAQQSLAQRDQRNAAKKRPLPYRESSDNYTAPIKEQLANTGVKLLNLVQKDRL